MKEEGPCVRSGCTASRSLRWGRRAEVCASWWTLNGISGNNDHSLPLLGRKLGYTFNNRNFHNVSLGQGQQVVAEAVLDLAAEKGHWVVLQVRPFCPAGVALDPVPGSTPAGPGPPFLPCPRP